MYLYLLYISFANNITGKDEKKEKESQFPL